MSPDILDEIRAGHPPVESDAASTRTGLARLTYPATNTARVLINTSRSATGNRSGSVNISGSQVTGSVTAGGFCGASKTYQIFFAIVFDRAPTGFGTCAFKPKRHA